MGKTGEHTIDFNLTGNDPNSRLGGVLATFAAHLAKRLLNLDALNGIYRNVMREKDDTPFADRVLETMGVRCVLAESDRERIPGTGPVIVTANHPFGGIEGIVLGSIMLSARRDVKIMANHLLEHIQAGPFREMCIFVDPFGKKDSVAKNVQPLREAVRWVRAGGMLGIFPAGEVAHLHLRKGCITDPEWNGGVAALVRMTKASVLPVFFEGGNSLLFQLFGLVHPRLRTILLPRELLKKRNGEIAVRIGKPIEYDKLSRFEDNSTMMKYLRLRTYMLQSRGKEREKHPRAPLLQGRTLQPIAPPPSATCVREEILALAPDQLMAKSGNLAVYRASARQIPQLLQEIGRMREITFRQVGEGTGKSIDLDRHDDYYTHLFLWDGDREELIGGYRLGLTEEILPRFGKHGLYTNDLFEYEDRFFREIGPAIELGRSFVRPEHQKSFHPLMLLWKGIGRFVSEHPECRTLFGPVSINNDYLSISRRLIVAFSKRGNRVSDLHGMVRGRHPLGARNPAERKRLQTACGLLGNIQDLSEIISDIETDRKGIPILLKHYMKLGGEFLAFSVDRNFGDVLDALILVDLTRTDPRILERYMGRDVSRSFLAHHRPASLGFCA